MNIKPIVLLSICFVSQSVSKTLIANDPPYYESHGYGTHTEGGLSGTVIHVSNLNQSGSGSFKKAIEASGARLVVFDVGGVIDADGNTIIVNNPYLTIAGQTAPSPGITLIKGGIKIRTHDVVIQHIAVRPGDAGQAKMSGWEPDAFSSYGTEIYNVVYDHCSATWAVDENLSVSGPEDSEPMTSSHDVTLYKCLIAECLSNSTHSKGEHSKGTLLHDGVANVSIIGCLYAHNARRNPLFKGNSRAVFVNNVIYNSGSRCIHMADCGKGSSNIIGQSHGTIVGNVWIKGMNSSDRPFIVAENNRRAALVYLEDNILKDCMGADMNVVDNLVEVLDTVPLWPEGLVAEPAIESIYNVLQTVGSRPGDRDSIDLRIIQMLIDRKGKIIDSQDEVGGYPSYTLTTRNIEVPEGKEARITWLDSLSAAIDTDESLDTSPLVHFFSPVGVHEQHMPQEYKLFLKNYPNPFNTSTRIQYYLPKSNTITLRTYNIYGQEIETLVDGYQTAGEYEVNWITNGLANGFYSCRIQSGEYSATKKMILQK
jgi:type IX secretion system substrate protein